MYSIEDLVDDTGYSKATIYNLSVKLGIKPQKGKVPGNIGKGIYSKEDRNKLFKYKTLILEGVPKEEAYERARA
jgi:hypothetical protein